VWSKADKKMKYCETNLDFASKLRKLDLRENNLIAK
jgi:hypothetical protein